MGLRWLRVLPTLLLASQTLLVVFVFIIAMPSQATKTTQAVMEIIKPYTSVVFQSLAISAATAMVASYSSRAQRLPTTSSSSQGEQRNHASSSPSARRAPQPAPIPSSPLGPGTSSSAREDGDVGIVPALSMGLLLTSAPTILQLLMLFVFQFGDLWCDDVISQGGRSTSSSSSSSGTSISLPASEALLCALITILTIASLATVAPLALSKKGIQSLHSTAAHVWLAVLEVFTILTVLRSAVVTASTPSWLHFNNPYATVEMSFLVFGVMWLALVTPNSYDTVGPIVGTFLAGLAAIVTGISWLASISPLMQDYSATATFAGKLPRNTSLSSLLGQCQHDWRFNSTVGLWVAASVVAAVATVTSLYMHRGVWRDAPSGTAMMVGRTLPPVAILVTFATAQLSLAGEPLHASIMFNPPNAWVDVALLLTLYSWCGLSPCLPSYMALIFSIFNMFLASIVGLYHTPSHPYFINDTSAVCQLVTAIIAGVGMFGLLMLAGERQTRISISHPTSSLVETEPPVYQRKRHVLVLYSLDLCIRACLAFVGLMDSSTVFAFHASAKLEALFIVVYTLALLPSMKDSAAAAVAICVSVCCVMSHVPMWHSLLTAEGASTNSKFFAVAHILEQLVLVGMAVDLQRLVHKHKQR